MQRSVNILSVQISGFPRSGHTCVTSTQVKRQNITRPPGSSPRVPWQLPPPKDDPFPGLNTTGFIGLFYNFM